MDPREVKIFESLRSLIDSQSKTINVFQDLVFQDLNELQPSEKTDKHKCKCSENDLLNENDLSINDPDVLWSANSTPLYEGMSLVTLLIKAEAFDELPEKVIGEDTQAILKSQGIKYVEYYDPEARIFTVLLYQPWYKPQTKEPTEILFTTLFSISSGGSGRLVGTIGRWSWNTKSCHFESFSSECNSSDSCQASMDYYNRRFRWSFCGGDVYCTRC